MRQFGAVDFCDFLVVSDVSVTFLVKPQVDDSVGTGNLGVYIVFWGFRAPHLLLQ